MLRPEWKEFGQRKREVKRKRLVVVGVVIWVMRLGVGADRLERFEVGLYQRGMRWKASGQRFEWKVEGEEGGWVGVVKGGLRGLREAVVEGK